MAIDKEKLLQAFPPGAMRVNGFDVGTVIRELIAAARIAPQSTYDETKERELFEATRNAHTVRRNEYGDYVIPSAQDAWCGWSQCAQSRAKAGEVDHE